MSSEGRKEKVEKRRGGGLNSATLMLFWILLFLSCNLGLCANVCVCVCYFYTSTQRLTASLFLRPTDCTSAH